MHTSLPTSVMVIATRFKSQILAGEQLSQELKIPFLFSPNLKELNVDFILWLTDARLELQNLNSELKPFYLDFNTPKLEYRRKHASLRKEMIAKALGVKPKQNSYIIDATAGLGYDSFILASLGFAVTMLERAPILHVLLRDALRRGKEDPKLKPLLSRLTLIHADAIDWLPKASVQPDIIYMDPMFPPKQKQASAKKEMVILQSLIGMDKDETKLLTTALACATNRVVVKRPRLSPVMLAHLLPFSYKGRSSRFDVYQPRKLTKDGVCALGP